MIQCYNDTKIIYNYFIDNSIVVDQHIEPAQYLGLTLKEDRVVDE